MTRSTRGGAIASTASSSPMCVVTWITRSYGVVEHHRVVATPVSSASSSVWPG